MSHFWDFLSPFGSIPVLLLQNLSSVKSAGKKQTNSSFTLQTPILGGCWERKFRILVVTSGTSCQHYLTKTLKSVSQTHKELLHPLRPYQCRYALTCPALTQPLCVFFCVCVGRLTLVRDALRLWGSLRFGTAAKLKLLLLRHALLDPKGALRISSLWWSDGS